MNARWATLQSRERLILIAGAGLAALILAWRFGWQPMQSGLADREQAVSIGERTLRNIQRAGSLPAVAAGPAIDDQSLFVIVDQTAKRSGLGESITRARPNGPDEIEVSIQNAEFDALIAWLISLEQTQGLRVENASVSSSRESGRVSGQVALRRS